MVTVERRLSCQRFFYYPPVYYPPEVLRKALAVVELEDLAELAAEQAAVERPVRAGRIAEVTPVQVVHPRVGVPLPPLRHRRHLMPPGRFPVL